jgi:IclR family transcriptional regulator, acetate operon repressor
VTDEPRGRSLATLERAFAVLAAFERSGREVLTLADLSRETGLPKTTAHRLVHLLVAERVLERRDGGYRLGMRLFELGELVPRKRDLREAALPFIQDLYEATHETVHFAVLDGTDVLYLERISGHRRVKVPSAVGGRLPAHCTGVGKALLAFTPAVADAVLRGPLVRRTPYTITVPAVLRSELERIGETGIAIDREESTAGVSCVAAPVMVRGSAVAAISVTGPTGRLRLDALAPAVRTAALGLSRTLTG